MKIRFCIYAIAAACIAASQANAADTRWKEISPPRTSGSFDTFDLSTPSGFKLCSPPADFPASNGMLIPIDPSIGCDRFDQNDPAHFPDAVRIYDLADAAMQYRDVKALARNVCSAKATMRPAGKLMGGLDTVLCTETLEGGATEELALAYYGEPENGTEIHIASIYHAENRARAAALHRQILSAIKFRPVSRR